MKTIELSGIVGADITAKGLKNKLPKDGSDVKLLVDSVGGSVYEGNRLYNAILDYPGNIYVELQAIAASAASYFPLAAGVENISVRENTTFMGHKAWTIMIGNSDDMKAEANILDGFDKLIAKVYSKITGKTIEESLNDMKDEFWLIGGQSVVDAGFASKVVGNDEAGNQEEVEPLDKSEVLAMIKNAKNVLRDQEKQEDLEKWAAQIDIALNTVDVVDEQRLLFSEYNSASSGKNNKGGHMNKDMTLNELLALSPKAKEEHDRILAEKDMAVSNAVDADRKRLAEVCNLAGIEIPKAALDGQTVEQFAVAELKERNEAIAKAKKEGKETDMGSLVAENQMPKPVNTKVDLEIKAKSDVESYLKGGK